MCCKMELIHPGYSGQVLEQVTIHASTNVHKHILIAPNHNNQVPEFAVILPGSNNHILVILVNLHK